jgi:hypothetical protein
MRMRTTLTLDDDIMKRLREKAVADDRPLKDIVNEALRTGLALGQHAASSYEFRLTTVSGRLLPGVDLTDRDKLFDLIDGLNCSPRRPSPATWCTTRIWWHSRSSTECMRS